ncbi:MAG: phosphotransferase [Parachlamydiales bacterium]
MPVCANNETQAVELLQNCLKVHGPFTFELLSGGCSGSEVIKVNTPDKAYVVRFWNMQWADYFPQDLACQLIASGAGYGPKVYFFDEVEGITIMEYYFPEALPEIQIRLQGLVDLLKKIHAGPAVPKGIDRAIYLDLLIEELEETPFFDLETLRTIKNTVFATTRPNASCVACHRDLHHGNLIYNQDSYSYLAIDYTWGAMDDPYADLANIAIFNCKTAEEEILLLQLYFGCAPSPKEIARLALMKLPAKIFYGLEFLGLAKACKIEELTPQVASKKYMDFGLPKGLPSTPTDFLNHAISLLGEVLDYSHSEHYMRDLKEINRH